MTSLTPCYITKTGSYLPGPRISNDQIARYLGEIDGEQEVKQNVLRMNGIVGRHYAQDSSQKATDDVYGLGAKAVCQVLDHHAGDVTYLSAGTTYAPMSGPGIGTMLHHHLREKGKLTHPIELSSHGGICTSSAAALVGAIRAVQTGEHASALSVGTEHASEVLKSSVIDPIDDRDQHPNIRRSQWFMSVFLRFMLSDGAGTFLLQNEPSQSGLSLRVDWTHSMSYAHSTQLCMKMETRKARLSQDVQVLSRYLFESSRDFLASALSKHGESLDHYHMILPHLSSFFFRRRMERIMQAHVTTLRSEVPYWTNLATAGNTGAASIYVMLDQFLKDHEITEDQRLLLFIPESGQFNFVLVSLTAVVQ
ncbi:MAG: hypothetical protein AAF664_21960 [Planctomycetota bacterium]